MLTFGGRGYNGAVEWSLLLIASKRTPIAERSPYSILCAGFIEGSRTECSSGSFFTQK